MANYSVYLIEANFLLAVLTGVYFLVRNQLSFAHRRFSLLLIPLLSAALFLFRLYQPVATSAIYDIPVFELNVVTISPSSDAALADSDVSTLVAIYWTGLVTGVLFLAFRLVKILVRLNSSKKEKRDGLTIVRIEDERCFSFLKYVQLNPALSAADQEVIFQHEKIHIAKRHSLDVLFMELIHAINWFNPVMILLRRELINVHEYEVDQVMYGSYKASYMEFLLAYALGSNSTPYLLTNQFYSTKSLIKRMDIMRTKPKNRWAIALTLPLVACSFALVSWTFVEGNGHQPTPNVSVENERLSGDPEKMPEYVGGTEAMVSYLSTNVSYPEKAKTDKIEGTVYVAFVVSKTGSVTDVKLRRGVHELLDAEAMRVIKAMPDWIPGEMGGEKVNVEMTLPIAFKL